MTTATGAHGDLFGWARELEGETGVSLRSTAGGCLGLAGWARDLVKQVAI